MPSPVGHALAGAAAGWLVAGAFAPAFARRDRWPSRSRSLDLLTHPVVRSGLWFAALGMLPDVDFLFGTHSTYTHSVGATLIVALAGLFLAPDRRTVFALASGAAYATHILLDWLGDDTTPPIGIMALWPLTSDFYQSDLHWFMAITRRYWLPNFWSHNLMAMAREMGLLLPILLLVWWGRVRGSESAHGKMLAAAKRNRDYA